VGTFHLILLRVPMFALMITYLCVGCNDIPLSLNGIVDKHILTVAMPSALYVVVPSEDQGHQNK